MTDEDEEWDELLTPRQVAEELGVNVSTIYEWVNFDSPNRPTLYAFRRGRRLWIPGAAVAEFMSNLRYLKGHGR